ncbi:hypothetical protein [Pedobacter sp. MC2016-24]|uniref:hypothetical protein n=1 Tax=Pedobacter sp. MC2016-24 TaxID=2780090 RepID=UPI00188191EC|nr:hypothetical protein [Pedobacter sp. MC2016-24]MBE9599881.1 hypothetical protein [Pedobacter sp. MC2016-24]
MQSQGNLNKNIRHTGISQQYIDQSIKMGIEILNDFMTADIPLLKKHPEFSMLWYTELLKVLRNENLLKEFQKRL